MHGEEEGSDCLGGAVGFSRWRGWLLLLIGKGGFMLLCWGLGNCEVIFAAKKLSGDNYTEYKYV